jgi:NAD(P)-dependent dehydrogenase (short-subunit alcohol dehydrogenase family)
MTEATARVVLITGTSSGIGLLTALEFARNGFRVIASMRDLTRSERLRQASSEAKLSNSIDVRQLDITLTDELPGKVAEIFAEYGRIDALVNNAGYALGGFAEDIALQELRDQFDTNFFGHVAMTKAVLPVMRQQGGGHIIMVSSIAGLVANPVTSSYSASKFALEGWSESLRIELRSLGIHVVLVEPGAFETDIWERNVKIGAQAIAESSLNKERTRRFANVVKTKLPKGDAREVARVIVRVAQDSSPRLRYLVGKDARARYIGKRLLPWKWYERLIEKATEI